MADPITAIGGKVRINDTTTIAHVRRASIDEEADNQTFVTSSTGGWQETTEGAKRWSATIDLLLEQGQFIDNKVVALKVGTLLTDIEFYTVSDTRYAYGKARVRRITGVEIDIEGSGNIGCTVEVDGHGALNKV